MIEKLSLKQKEIKNKLSLAKIYLSSAENSLKTGDFRLATDASYNALELTMKAAILLKRDSFPRRHGGVAQLFSLLYLKEETIDSKYGAMVGKALEFRNKARYDEEATITKNHAKDNIKLAKTIIKLIPIA